MKIVKLKICLCPGKSGYKESDFQYFSYVIADRLKYYYLEDSTYIEITFREFLTVIHNPYLYYFSTALKLHTIILNKNNPNWFREV